MIFNDLKAGQWFKIKIDNNGQEQLFALLFAVDGMRFMKLDKLHAVDAQGAIQHWNPKIEVEVTDEIPG